ncbi:hypothetical protein glysoja_044187 [Glycine soja]|uniref:Uncharacterized protein n=1 Tax=Glycine soja TaxID=3848 RepID=A0A0B2Q1B3_GLYSO|nr:hypothetical protein glysoja_044187 [Glycine soja]
MAHPEGELDTARAASAAGTIMKSPREYKNIFLKMKHFQAT